MAVRYSLCLGFRFVGMEHITSCLHPVRVYNKYIDEHVWVSCGKCDACKRRKSNKWIVRLEQERKVSRFTFFVTLTYDEKHLPRLFFSADGCFIQDSLRGVSIPFDELRFLSAADRQYFDKRMTLSGIPYASVTDIQKFHKRLNKYIHDNITKTYKNFRYWTVSEFGSTSLRPHFHGIYFIQDQRVAERFEDCICACWQNGISDTQFVKSTASSYVAQYLNELFDLPSFYQHGSLRPFFVCSKQPPIGGSLYNKEEFRTVFEEAQTSVLVQRFATDTTLSNVPLLPCVENRLFPKCQAFGRISHSLRVALYGIAERWFYFKIEESPLNLRFRSSDFDCFVSRIRHYISDGYGFKYHRPTELTDYLVQISHGFSERGINCLRRLYYLSKRVINQCRLWKVSLEYYIRKIEDYWNKKEIECLSAFYSFQENFDNPEELVHLYPEFAYQNNDCVISLEDCEDYKVFKSDSEFGIKKVTKSHFKNAYFDSLKERGEPLFEILLIYYYAKKCNEIIETFGFHESE